jgi:hypothetical protein
MIDLASSSTGSSATRSRRARRIEHLMTSMMLGEYKGVRIETVPRSSVGETKPHSGGDNDL